MEKIKELYFKHREIIAYIIVGGLTTFVRWGTAAIFESLFTFIGNEVTRNVTVTIVSLLVTILFAFPLNKLIVFESKSFKKNIVGVEFIAFLSARAIASLIELVGIPFICWMFDMKQLIATMLISIIVLLVNYIFSKLFIFKDREGKKDKKDKKGNKENTASARDKLIATILVLLCFVVFAISFSFWTVEMVTGIFGL